MKPRKQRLDVKMRHLMRKDTMLDNMLEITIMELVIVWLVDAFQL